MARKLNDEQLRELDHLKEWCRTILNFTKSKDPGTTYPIWDMMLDTVVKCHADRDLRGMRMMASDMSEMARGMTLGELKRLNVLLKKHCGEDLSENRSKDLAKITQIRRRGRIRTENEFRLVQGRTEEIWDDEGKRDEMEALNKLLADF